MKHDNKYWKEYYSKKQAPNKPSPFALDILSYIENKGTLIELGCGNGRDSIFFAKKLNINIVAIDQCEEEIEYLNNVYGSPNLSFVESDFTNYRTKSKVQTVYSRWTMHSIDESGEDRTLDWITETLKSGGRFIVEARSIQDDLYGQGQDLGNDAFITDHYRRFMRIDKFIKKLTDRGFVIIHSIESRGLARYKDDDPFIIRVVAEKL